ncbi:MAG: DNA repair protein RadA, partial [Ignavibacteriae bacterium]|nr:DNA repair protein RadA [Ignavibacteriota bacterium]
MAKHKIKYICSNCGFESLKWQGKCPHCEEWNTFSEEFVEAKKTAKKQKVKEENIYKLSEVNSHDD